MTFSDRRVIDLLNDEFVCVWRNRAPGTPWEGYPRINDWDWRRRFPQGTGNGAVNLYFCSSNGFTMNELGGFWAPGDFLEEARFALDVARDLTRGGEEVRRDVAARELTARHDQEVGRLERLLRDLQSMKRVWGPEHAARMQALSQRIGFHRLEAQQPLRDVEALYNPRPIRPIGG